MVSSTINKQFLKIHNVKYTDKQRHCDIDIGRSICDLFCENQPYPEGETQFLYLKANIHKPTEQV